MFGIKYAFKIITLGDCAVGKSTLIQKFSKFDYLLSGFPTKMIEINNEKIELQLWDLNSFDRLKLCSEGSPLAFTRATDGVLLIYDITRRESFDNIEKWHDVAVNRCDVSIQYILVANKSDLEDHVKEQEQDHVSFEEGQNLADKLEIPFIVVSATQNKNIDEAFYILAENILINQT